MTNAYMLIVIRREGTYLYQPTFNHLHSGRVRYCWYVYPSERAIVALKYATNVLAPDNLNTNIIYADLR